MNALALLVTVWLTLPRCQAVAGCDSMLVVCNGSSCDTAVTCLPETQLATLRVWWWERWTPSPRILREKDVRGREGQRDSLQLPDWPVASVFVTTLDSAGNESCPSNMTTVNGTVAVDPADLPEIRWYDVQGRRVRCPSTPGVYFREERTRTTRSHRKVVWVGGKAKPAGW